VDNRSGDGTGSGEVQVVSNASEITNMEKTRARERGDLIRKRQVFVKDEAKIASRVSEI